MGVVWEIERARLREEGRNVEGALSNKAWRRENRDAA